MAQEITILNDSGAVGTWGGQYLAIAEAIVVSDYQRWQRDDVTPSFTSGDLKIYKTQSIHQHKH